MGAQFHACEAGAMKPLRDDLLRDARQRLLARAGDLRERLRRVQADLGRAREPLPRDSADAAIVMENDEVLRAIESTSTSEIRHIEHALERLDAGAFGVCENCGGDVGAPRLQAVPYATRCGDCERNS
jgi:RNA polymerase-binding transcription factor DksA